jgi:hypothetical protein
VSVPTEPLSVFARRLCDYEVGVRFVYIFYMAKRVNLFDAVSGLLQNIELLA